MPFKYYGGSKAFWALIESMSPFSPLTVDEAISLAESVGIQVLRTSHPYEVGKKALRFAGNSIVPLNEDGLLPVCSEVQVDVEAQQVFISPQLGETVIWDPHTPPQFSHTLSSEELRTRMGYQVHVLDFPETVFLWANPFDPVSPRLMLRQDLVAEQLKAASLLLDLNRLLSS